MNYKMLLSLYLLCLLLMAVVPLGVLSATLVNTSVLQLRLDYLVHGLVFSPLVVLWRMGYPRHRLGMIVAVGFVLVVGLEGIQYVLPYRTCNMNDAIGNGTGFVLGVGFEMIRKQRLTSSL